MPGKRVGAWKVYGPAAVAMTVLLLGRGLTWAAVGSASPRFALTRNLVAGTMNAEGFAVTPAQVSMLAEVFAVKSQPILEILAVSSWGGSQDRVEVGCRNRRECLPFFVLVAWPDRVAAVRAVEYYRRTLGEDPAAVSAAGPAAGSASGSASGPEDQPRPVRRPARGVDGPKPRILPEITLRAGAHATLLIDQGRLHIRMAVICLENGPVGGKIRVQSEDHKQIYVAEVLDGASLRGSL